MKPQNSLTAQAQKKPVTFSAAITSGSMQQMITKSLGDQKAAARFTSTMISAVSGSEQLKACKPETVVAAALRGEGMGLVYGHGYYVTPYGSTATFVTSYKGYIQLALATGLYADIDCIDVREGEVKGRDPRKGKPIIDLSVYQNDEERESKPIVGYYGYFELKDGTFRYEYWSMEKLLKHADRYSPAFDLERYNKMVSGEMPASEAQKLRGGTPWYDAGGSGQEKMCKKTVMRSLLNSGYAPLSNEVKTFVSNDRDDVVTGDGNMINADYQVIDMTTGEVIGDVSESGEVITPDAGENTAQGQEKPNRGRKAADIIDDIIEG